MSLFLKLVKKDGRFTYPLFTLSGDNSKENSKDDALDTDYKD